MGPDQATEGTPRAPELIEETGRRFVVARPATRPRRIGAQFRCGLRLCVSGQFCTSRWQRTSTSRDTDAPLVDLS